MKPHRIQLRYLRLLRKILSMKLPRVPGRSGLGKTGHCVPMPKGTGAKRALYQSPGRSTRRDNRVRRQKTRRNAAFSIRLVLYWRILTKGAEVGTEDESQKLRLVQNFCRHPARVGDLSAFVRGRRVRLLRFPRLEPVQ